MTTVKDLLEDAVRDKLIGCTINDVALKYNSAGVLLELVLDIEKSGKTEKIIIKPTQRDY